MRDRDGGRVLLTQAIHTLDLMLHLARPATSVMARCAASGLREIDTGASGGGGGADPMAFAPDSHRRLSEEFLDAVIEEREPSNSGASALAVYGLIDAMLRSSADGAAPPVAGIDGPRAGR